MKKWKKHRRCYHFTIAFRKWRPYDAWFLRYGARQTGFFVILGHCLFFHPTNNPKNQNFEKIKKAPGDIFCPFTPLKAPKIKILKKWKKRLEISFYTCVPKIKIRWDRDGRMDRQADGQTDEKVIYRSGCST